MTTLQNSPRCDNGKLTSIVDVLEFCLDRDLPAEIVGRWVWLQFPEKPSKETRDALKAAGFRWVKIRGKWAHNCGVPSKKGTGDPYWKYGHVRASRQHIDELKEVG